MREQHTGPECARITAHSKPGSHAFQGVVDHLTALSRWRSAITAIVDIEERTHGTRAQVATATATATAEAVAHHPVTTAAAAHTVSNWLVLSVLLVSLSGLLT